MKLQHITEDFTLVTDSQEIEHILESVKNNQCIKENVSGVAVVVVDGEYAGVWITESSRPYSVESEYEKVEAA